LDILSFPFQSYFWFQEADLETPQTDSLACVFLWDSGKGWHQQESRGWEERGQKVYNPFQTSLGLPVTLLEITVLVGKFLFFFLINFLNWKNYM
jgi:hypothetical protein